MTTLLLVLPVAAPAAAALLAFISGRHRQAAMAACAAAVIIAACGGLLAVSQASMPDHAFGGLLRADALTATLLIIIGTVGIPATWAGIGYLAQEIAGGHSTPRRVRWYSTLVPAFLGAMALAVVSGNIGLTWAAVEATTVITAFLVGHRRGRAALEAAWKYVVICSVGIALALLGTVLLYFAAVHAGVPAEHALDIETLLHHAGSLDPAVTRTAAGLLLIGYGAKAGLIPFHSWLADAHSQAPAPVSALMSGVLLAVGAFALLRVKPVIDMAVGTGFLRGGLLVVGLATVALAALMLVGQTDYKRMLAYSSMENMGLVAIAAAVGSRLAMVALLLHVLAHGIAKTLLFLAAGQLQHAHGSTAIAAVRGVLARSRLIGVAMAIGVAAVVALPPFGLFGSVVSIARSLAEARLIWVLAALAILLVIAFAGMAERTVTMLLGNPDPDAPAIAVPRSLATALAVGVIACVALGITMGPLGGLFAGAADIVAVPG